MKHSPADILWLNEVDSTNRFALENFDMLNHGAMVVASNQSAGRGSHGRSWQSPPDVNVYASLVLKDFAYAPPQAAWIGSLAALAVLREHAPDLEFKVKWPNDVLCGRKKIAGILCESIQGRHGIVIGTGLNVNMTPDVLESIGRPATSLYAETGLLADDVGAYAVELRAHSLALFARAERYGIDSLRESWSRENILTGRSVVVRTSDGVMRRGVVSGFDSGGALLLVDPSGFVFTVSSGDVLF